MSVINGFSVSTKESNILALSPKQEGLKNGQVVPAVTIPGAPMTSTKKPYNGPRRMVARSISVPKERKTPILSFADAVADATKAKCLEEQNRRKVSAECLNKPGSYIRSLSEGQKNQLHQSPLNSSRQSLSDNKGPLGVGSDYDSFPKKRLFTRQNSAPILRNYSATKSSSPQLRRGHTKEGQPQTGLASSQLTQVRDRRGAFFGDRFDVVNEMSKAEPVSPGRLRNLKTGKMKMSREGNPLKVANGVEDNVENGNISVITKKSEQDTPVMNASPGDGNDSQNAFNSFIPSVGTSFVLSGRAKSQTQDEQPANVIEEVTSNGLSHEKGPATCEGSVCVEAGALFERKQQRSNDNCAGIDADEGLDLQHRREDHSVTTEADITDGSVSVQESHLSQYENVGNQSTTEGVRDIAGTNVVKDLDSSNNNLKLDGSNISLKDHVDVEPLEISQDDNGNTISGKRSPVLTEDNRRDFLTVEKKRLSRTDTMLFESKSESNLLSTSLSGNSRIRRFTPKLGRKPGREFSGSMDRLGDGDFSPPVMRKRCHTVGTVSLSPLRLPKWRFKKGQKSKDFQGSGGFSNSTDNLILSATTSPEKLSAQEQLLLKREQQNFELSELELDDDVFCKHKDLKTFLGVHNKNVSPSSSPVTSRRQEAKLFINTQKSASLGDCASSPRRNVSPSKKHVNFSNQLTFFDEEDKKTKLAFVKDNESSPSWFRKFFSKYGQMEGEVQWFDEEEELNKSPSRGSNGETSWKRRYRKSGTSSPQRNWEVASHMRQLKDIAYLEVEDQDCQSFGLKENSSNRSMSDEVPSPPWNSKRSRTRIKTQLSRPSSKQPFLNLRRMFSATSPSQTEPLLGMEPQARRRSKSDSAHVNRKHGHYAVVGQCLDCGYKVRAMDLLSVSGNIFHASCFRGNRM
ncbi:hypothetical protein HOLleu_39106 [Holothuria leucospilota]|uniref:Uncharacterized protein n=1 Tax=Holothuria leucospilota TaxID=206669 RepID=A0A9Q0YFP6_HOLLE|nr:hypothetical protein HOLleu_39106 [Holothuria leucospilota]